MAEYIEREATLAFLREVYCADCKGGTRKTICRICNINDVIDSVANVPAADVAPVVHGRWIPQSNNAGVEYTICSACRCSLRVVAQTGSESGLMDMRGVPYCPSCGAKMDGGADNAETD